MPLPACLPPAALLPLQAPAPVPAAPPPPPLQVVPPTPEAREPQQQQQHRQQAQRQRELLVAHAKLPWQSVALGRISAAARACVGAGSSAASQLQSLLLGTAAVVFLHGRFLERMGLLTVLLLLVAALLGVMLVQLAAAAGRCCAAAARQLHAQLSWQVALSNLFLGRVVSGRLVWWRCAGHLIKCLGFPLNPNTSDRHSSLPFLQLHNFKRNKCLAPAWMPTTRLTLPLTLFCFVHGLLASQ